MANIIQIDDGTKEYNIENKYGQVLCTFYLRPTDLDIMERSKKAAAEFKTALKKLESIGLNADGTATDESNYEIVKEVGDEVVGILSRLFDSDVSDVFKTRSPFSMVGDKFLCTRLQDAVTQVIEQEMMAAAEESRKRTEKYIED